MLEKIIHNKTLLAIIIGSTFNQEGIEFFTENESPQQLGYMNRPKDYIVKPHRHNKFQRDVQFTQEVLYIKSGKVRVDFYNNEQKYIESRILEKGDVILLAEGGHGFKMLEPSEIIEVKQGPYCREGDKVCFSPIDESSVLLK